MDEERLIQTALDCGATGADMVGQDGVIMDPSFRSFCEENSCGMYGRCYMCPPDIGPVEELIAQVRSFDRGLLYHTVSPLEDSFDIEGMQEAGRNFTIVCQKVLSALRPSMEGAFFLTGGGCGLCPQCAKPMGQPCRHPERALPSLESHGIDVYNTTRSTSLRYINGPNTVTYFGLILFRETNDG